LRTIVPAAAIILVPGRASETIDHYSLTARIVSELNHKLDAISDVGAVLPDAAKGNGPFRDLHIFNPQIFKWPKHAVLLFSRDGHRSTTASPGLRALSITVNGRVGSQWELVALTGIEPVFKP
jgi:hypothetical protein